MLGFFREDAPAWLRRLHQAMTNNDLPAVRFAAHTLKGQASNFGAERAVQAAAAVESAARELRPTELPAGVRDLDAAFKELLSAADEITPNSREAPLGSTSAGLKRAR
jgi:HPt (histidine-containing phosphotransfer) domain-containing protein